VATILLIEDDTPLRKYLRTLLSGAGYSLEEAETGEQGIRLASRMMPALVILDLGLPDVDGQDVLRALREKLQVPIVVLSGREQPIDKIEALDPALLRPGRIDFRLYLGKASDRQKAELYQRFFPQASEFEAEMFVEDHRSAETMAEFQGLLLALEEKHESQTPVLSQLLSR
jgi:CheY-like chemotaxis protein